MESIKKRAETKYNIIFRKDYTTPSTLIHCEAILPRASKAAMDLSIQSEKANPPVLTTGLCSTNQYLTIIPACYCRNHEGFQLTDIFPFTSEYPQDHARFFCYTFY